MIVEKSNRRFRFNTDTNYRKLQGEWTQLTYRLEHADEEVEPSEVQQQKRQQELIARYQGALAKRHAAKSISDTYQSILAILKKVSSEKFTLVVIFTRYLVYEAF